MTLHLNLKPDCLGLCGPDTDACMKLVTLFFLCYFTETLQGNDGDKVVWLRNGTPFFGAAEWRKSSTKFREYNVLFQMKCLVLIVSIKY